MLPSLPELLSELIAVRSVAGDREACLIALGICRNALSGLRDVTFHEVEKDGHPSLVARYRSDRNPDIMLVAHADVVPAPSASFAPKVEGGRIFGRGAVDMKGPLTAMIRAFHRHAASKGAISLALIITTDEEIGGACGVKHLIEEEGYRPRCAVVPDAPYDFKVITLQYGIVRVRVRRKGKAAHSSSPEDGDNAIDSFYETYRSFVRSLRKIPDAVFSLATIKGGVAMNVVPDLCEAAIDIRTANVDDVVALIHRTFRRGEFEIISTEPAYAVDRKHPCIQTFIQTARNVLKRPVTTKVLRGATDARYLSRFSIPVVIVGPRGGGHHGDHEWVDIESLKQLEEMTVRFLKNGFGH